MQRTDVTDVQDVVRPAVSPPGPTALALRLVLAIALVVVMGQLAAQPVRSSVDALRSALDAGQVTQMQIVRPGGSELVVGSFTVTWRVGPWTYTAQYQVDTMSQPRTDEGADLISAAERSPSPVDVVRLPEQMLTGTHWNLWALAPLATLFLLIGGPQPRWATKWAWFWLFSAGPMILVFVLLEPIPLWRRAPAPARARRLTGWWAVLLVVLFGGVLDQLMAGWLPTLAGHPAGPFGWLNG